MPVDEDDPGAERSRRQPIQVLVHPVRLAGNQWEYLLLRRIPSRGGFWQGVTGGVEGDEDLEEAARRELIEETGYVPITLKRIEHSYSFPIEKRVSHLFPGASEFMEHVFLAYVEGGKEPVMDPNEHDGYRWCRLDEALGLLKWPENKDALKRCSEAIAASGSPD
ncbi:MAG: NUDIX pyrophosphatase [Thermoplasmata archaeon]